MKRASVSQAKNSLSAYLAEVREGNSILITDRGEPVAVLAPVPRQQAAQRDVLRKLIRQGVVRAPLKQKSRALPPLVKVASNTIALDILAQDRED
jgi:prevent-host-death family protein